MAKKSKIPKFWLYAGGALVTLWILAETPLNTSNDYTLANPLAWIVIVIFGILYAKSR